MDSGIYQIKNTVNGKVYVGLSIHMELRWGEHLALLRNGCHYNRHLQGSYDKYGEGAFEFSVLEYCDDDRLREREKFWIEKTGAYNNGYNLTLGGDGVSGYVQSEEEKERRAAAIRKNYADHPERKVETSKRSRAMWQDQEQREKILANLREATRTDEYRQKLSSAAKKNWSDEEYLSNQAARFQEASRTPEAQAKRNASVKKTYANDPVLRMRIGAMSRSNWESEEYREKHRESHSKAVQSTEYKAKQSAISKERWQDPAYREKVCQAAKLAAEPRSRSVQQVETGIVFNSVAEAAQSVGCLHSTAHITDCCLGHRRTAYGYHWRYAGETQEEWRVRRDEWVKENDIKAFRRVVCVETGEEFEQAKYAAERVGKHPSNIVHCCAGRQDTCGGYHWKYAE